MANALKPFGPCPCSEQCGTEGKYRTRAWNDGLVHTRDCACRRCSQGGHSDRGQKSQRKVARKAGVPLSGLGPGKEQNWRGPWRMEVKDDQSAKKVADFYLSTRLQSEKDKSLGDLRPFAAIAVHGGTEYAVIKLDDMDNAADAWIERTQ